MSTSPRPGRTAPTGPSAAPPAPSASPAPVAPDGFPADPRWDGWMLQAVRLAEGCAATGDVPVGALVVGPDGAVVGEGRNERERRGDPTAHAEVLALQAAAATLGRRRLDGCTLVVTLEPCAMCAGALLAARVDGVVLGAWDDKAGACGSVWDLVRDPRALHRATVVGGIRGAQCAGLLRDFFAGRRLG